MHSVHNEPLSPLHFLERSATVFPGKVAVVYGEERYTYSQFRDRVHRLAGALKAAGVGKGDRVACLLPNTPALLEAHFGVPLAGGVLVAINTRLSPGEVAYILQHSEARVLVVDAELSPVVAPGLANCPALRLVVTDVREPGHARSLPGEPYEQWLQGASPGPYPNPVEDEGAMISINYTSGTTGRPKGVVYSHRGAFLNAVGQCLELGLNARSTYLWTLPMFHCNGWCYPWAVTAAGGTHVCLRKVEPADVVRLWETASITHMCGAPTVLTMLAAHLESTGTRPNLTQPLTVATGGAPPSPAIIRSIEGVGINLVHLYGLTESYGPFTVCEWQQEWDELPLPERARLKARQGTVFPLSGFLRVADEQGNPVPQDASTMGEVQLRGNSIMLGYFGDPESTGKAFAGGWFHTGDLGVWHPDGYIELRDRSKDVIISGGENISSIEVEKCIADHPAVLEVAVVGVPDPQWGEVPKAFVTLKQGQDTTAAEIIAFCRARIARFKCPKTVVFTDLPKTSTGKIQKFVLRDAAWQGQGRKIN